MFGREMNGFWQWRGQPLQKQLIYSDYTRYNQRKHAREVSFTAGQTVLYRRGPSEPFQHRAIIIQQAGKGAWLLRLQNNKTQVLNQRYIRRAPTATHRMDSHYSREPQESVTQSKEPRYNLRPRTCDASRYKH